MSVGSKCWVNIPKLGNAVSHIFEPSYEYTRAYREFKREVTRLGCC